MKRLYVRVKDKHDPRDHHYTLVPNLELPVRVDLSDKCSAIEDQGQLGACTGHAIAGLLEGTIRQDAGAEIRDGIKTIATYGACDEGLWPYLVDMFRHKPTQLAYDNGLLHKAIEYQRVGQSEVELINCLAVGHPIVFGINIYDSFESDEVAKTGIVPLPTLNEQCLGGHAVLIVGYDKEKRRFKVRNSWGPDWGDQGHFWLPFDYVLNSDLAEDFWTVSKIS